MAKYFGKVGFFESVETKPGIYKNQITEHSYYGDVTNIGRRFSNGESVNDNITINHEFSIVADPFAQENYYNILYVEYMGCKWKVSTVTVQFPRLLLTVGGVYNGEE